MHEFNVQGQVLSQQIINTPLITLPVSVIPTVKSFLKTSDTTCEEAWLNCTKGVVNMVDGKRAGTSRAVHVLTASSRTFLCSEDRYMSATFCTNWSGKWAIWEGQWQ